MRWEVEYTDQFEDWWVELLKEDQEAITAAVEVLEEQGPGLGRPLVDTVSGSRHANMKELRPPGNIRILFVFDPRRIAILLLGGDKTGRWSQWYRENIPIADGLYDDHLAGLQQEGALLWQRNSENSARPLTVTLRRGLTLRSISAQSTMRLHWPI